MKHYPRDEFERAPMAKSGSNMKHITTRLAVRAFLACVSPTVAHADDATHMKPSGGISQGLPFDPKTSTHTWTSSSFITNFNTPSCAMATIPADPSEPVTIDWDCIDKYVAVSPTDTMTAVARVLKAIRDGKVVNKTASCAPGYEANCQQRDQGTDGLRR